MSELNRHCQYFESYLRKAKREFNANLQRAFKETGSIHEFELLKVIGSGSFGKVFLCKRRFTMDQLYAMKVMEKANIIKTKQLVHTISEIRYLDAFRFPFIVNLEFFFKDNVYLYLVMPFVAGGEMFFHLRARKKFEENLCKFYASQVLMAFEYMHNLGVVYRDLKPENILIENDGYLKLTDLGFCKKIDDSRTYTLCGTPEYLAPEVILSQGYTYSVDWWAFGILIYEMAAGFPPFYSKDPMKLYEKIVSGRYMCPTHFSKPLRELSTNLIQVDRTKRMGVVKGGCREIKHQEWFKGVNFDRILNKALVPSFLPPLDGVGDTKFFETDENFHLRKSDVDEFAEEFKDLSVK